MSFYLWLYKNTRLMLLVHRKVFETVVEDVHLGVILAKDEEARMYK